MTREELWSTFPRPWRLCEEEPGVVLCADGSEALVVGGVTRTLEDDSAMAELLVDFANGERDERQREIASWASATFGADQASSVPQRALRMLEEAIEAYQAAGGDAAMAHKLVDFMFGRPKGELAQEIGGVPHQHPDTGPACYTIDKDEWVRDTGLRGGGRKKFTKVPTGEQFPIVELEEWQKSFEIIYGPPPKGPQYENATGPGIALPLRLVKGFGMTISAVKSGGK